MKTFFEFLPKILDKGLDLIANVMGKLGKALKRKQTVPDERTNSLVSPEIAPTATSTPEIAQSTSGTTQTPPAPILSLDFSTPHAAYHSVRVISDEMGLPLAHCMLVDGVYYQPKDKLCAMIYEESRFKIGAKGSINSNGTQDFGLCQYNNGKNKEGKPLWIGQGAAFSSVEDVYANPERQVRLMVQTCYFEGHWDWWSSHKTGAYKKWLLPNSPMWSLKS